MRVSIIERDVSVASIIQSAFDTPIHVIGCANIGPEQPTLCKTLNEFIYWFGDKPFKFSADQKEKSSDTDLFQLKDTYEKGYVMAYEYLKAGGMVEFRRMVDATASKGQSVIQVGDYGNIVISAKDYGQYAANITYNIESELDENQKLTVEYLDKTETFNINLDHNSDRFIGSVISRFINVDTSELLTSIIEEGVQLANIPETEDAGLSWSGDEITVEKIFTAMKDDDFWKDYKEKDTYDYFFLTTGPYATIGAEAAGKPLQAGAVNGLGVVIEDILNKVNENQEGIGQLLSSIKTLAMAKVGGEQVGKYGAAFFKKRKFNTTFGEMELPAGFAYIMNFIYQCKTRPWEAIAGIGANNNGRGVVHNIVDYEKLGGAVSDLLQPDTGVRVNPIQYIRGVGNVIMGNATLNFNGDGLTNSSFLSVRVLTALVKRYFYELGKKALFEQNNSIAYYTLKNKGEEFMNLLLDRGLRTEVNGKPVQPYTISRLPSERATLKILVAYYPVEAIERVEEIIELKDGYVNI